MNTSKPLVAVLAALAVGSSVPDRASAHREGSWLRAAEVQQRVEARGYGLAICRGRGPGRLLAPIPDQQFALFRHFECFVNIRGSGVLCVHTQPGKRIAVAPRPPDQRRCRF
jgi:hypothetical protein